VGWCASESTSNGPQPLAAKTFLHMEFGLSGTVELVPRPAKSDELLLQATYHDSNVHDDCHSIFDRFVGSGRQ
jgi:hypothetical protein